MDGGKPTPGKVREERRRNERRTEAVRLEVRMILHSHSMFVYPSDTVLIRLGTLGFVAVVGLRDDRTPVIKAAGCHIPTTAPY